MSRKRAYRERADYANIKLTVYIFDPRVSNNKTNAFGMCSRIVLKTYRELAALKRNCTQMTLRVATV